MDVQGRRTGGWVPGDRGMTWMGLFVTLAEVTRWVCRDDERVAGSPVTAG